MQPPETVALRATGHRQGPLRARTPSARRRAIAGVARLGLTALPPTRRPSNRPRTVLESSSNRPRIVLEPSSNRPRTVPPGSTARITPSRRHAPECLGSARSPRPSMLVKSVGIRGLLTRSRCWGATSARGGGAHPIEWSQTTKPSLGTSPPMAWGSLVLRAPGRRMKRGSISARIKPPAASSKLGFFQTEGLRRRAISPSALGFPQSAASHRRAIRR